MPLGLLNPKAKIPVISGFWSRPKATGFKNNGRSSNFSGNLCGGPGSAPKSPSTRDLFFIR